MAALVALLDMPAERGGPAQFNGDAALDCRQRRVMLDTKGLAVATEEVRRYREHAQSGRP